MSASISAKPYEVIALDAPPNWNSLCKAINNQGEAAGTVSHDMNDPSQVRACRWMTDGTRIDLGSGVGETEAYAINAGHEVAGMVTTAHYPIVQRAAAWDASGVMRMLPETGLRGFRESAMSINDKGWIVGNALVQDGPCHAFVWLPGAQPRELPSPTGGDCAVCEINNKGESVGFSTGEPRFGIYWNDGRVPRRLQGLGSRIGAAAYGINDQGDISGMSFVHGRSETIATLWKVSSGQITELPNPPGVSGCVAFATLSNGYTVGEARYPNNSSRAVVWKGKTVQFLSDLVELNGWRLDTARAINQRGDIVGWGKSPQGLLSAYLVRVRIGPAGAQAF